MFLLPAIGAWISDGLILYLYFAYEGGGDAVNNSGGDNFVTCGNFDGASPCRRIRVPKPSLVDIEGGSMQQNRTALSSFPNVLEGESPTSFGKSNVPEDENHDREHKASISAKTVESKTWYLSVLAIIRLILLTFPLAYAAYSGTRVPCAIAQYIFHGMSAIAVVSHMLAVLVIEVDPYDLNIPKQGDTPGGDTSEGDANIAIVGDAWTLLSLSLVSIMLHFLVVLHVRSTGPLQEGLYEKKRRGKQLAYAITSQSVSGTRLNEQHDNDDDMEGHGGEPLLRFAQGNNNKELGRSMSFKERFMNLPDQYEAFVCETQTRFDRARRMWSDRLEAMTQSLQRNNLNNSTHGPDGALQSPPRNLESSKLIGFVASNATKLVPMKPDPFRVLLQLFAYEDVWSNNQLDLAFSTDAVTDDSGLSAGRSAALSFYAPQLLSFLLHGAYFDFSAKLEEWILQKCSVDLSFAHRCFWFLRSWCLGNSSEARHFSFGSINSLERIGGMDKLSLEPDSPSSKGGSLRGVEANLYLSSCHTGIPAPPLLGEEVTIDPPEYSIDETSKFSPDEQLLIEQLLYRVVERGSRPATVAQYGSTDGRDSTDDTRDSLNGYSSSPSALATAVEQGLIPVDPRTGVSSRHLECVSSVQKHGFLPLDDFGEPYHRSNLSNDAASLFFAAPTFLDALLSVADDLMNASRDSRTVELRRRLRSLEVELLPSNVVYLPIRNIQHRVWRIVSGESIALSTKERVPCIITLEVIVSDVSEKPNNDSAIVSAWVNDPRPPNRHNTLIDKVANYTQEGFKRLENTVDRLSHHGEGAGAFERRLKDYLGGQKQMYTAVNSYDDDHDDSSQDDLTSEGRELGEMTAQEANGDKDADCVTLQPALRTPPSSDDNPGEAPKTPQQDPETYMESVGDDIDMRGSPMGQWATPRRHSPNILRNRNNNLLSSFDETIGKENSVGQEFSPQAKQRKKVAFPMNAGDASDEESQIQASSEPKDTHLPASSSATAPAVVFKEDWKAKTERLRQCSIYGSHPGWRLLPILMKSNDDLRQEQLASQLIQRMALILARGRVPVWLYPYEIVALTSRGGIIECVPDTISIDSLKRNDPGFTTLKRFFEQHFSSDSDELSNAKANFVESLAAYSIVCFLLQIKDRHNGNILLDNKGHIVHIDFGFFFLSSPGQNTGFESAPFKLTREMVDLLGGHDSYTFQKYRELCYKTFLELRKHCYQIILLVEMLMEGNEDLACFRGRPEEAVTQLKKRFRLDLNDNGIRKYVDSLIDESLENWRTRWYDRYQRFCVGVF